MAYTQDRGGIHERTRIDLDDPIEVQDWTEELGVPEARLREAVAAVGNEAEAVREYLAAHSVQELLPHDDMHERRPR